MTGCPELETLFQQLAEGAGEALEHAKTCPDCTRLIEEHKRLEHELFKLSDPLPPASFVPQVMAKIATAPAPAGREWWTGLTVLFGSVGTAAALFFSRPGAVQHLGVRAADAARDGLSFATALPGGLSTLWHHAAVPGALCGALLLASLYGLKKLAGTPQLSDTRVSA